MLNTNTFTVSFWHLSRLSASLVRPTNVVSLWKLDFSNLVGITSKESSTLLQNFLTNSSQFKTQNSSWNRINSNSNSNFWQTDTCSLFNTGLSSNILLTSTWTRTKARSIKFHMNPVSWLDIFAYCLGSYLVLMETVPYENWQRCIHILGYHIRVANWSSLVGRFLRKKRWTRTVSYALLRRI